MRTKPWQVGVISGLNSCSRILDEQLDGLLPIDILLEQTAAHVIMVANFSIHARLRQSVSCSQVEGAEMKPLLWVLIVWASISMAAAQSADQRGNTTSEISRALSAAPPQIARKAAVVSMDDKGQMKELRHGKNGWTCIPHDPATPMGHPLCLDKNGLEWMAVAMAGHTPPDPDKIGYCYMLKGGTSWSNTDFSATKLPPGQKDFIRIPPHFMILNAKIANSSGFPSGEARPNTHKPFVMYGGTPYAVLMIPLE